VSRVPVWGQAEVHMEFQAFDEKLRLGTKINQILN
jgi:hypothetical protein